MNQIEKILNKALLGNVISVEELRQYSVLNLLMIVVERVNGVIENNNYLASEGLELEVINQIKNMIDDGTLPNLLNQTMLAEIIASVNKTEGLVNDRPTFQKVTELIAQAKLDAGTVETDGLIYKSDIEAMLIYSVNKFNPSTMIKDQYLSYGVLTDYEGWNTTDYIRLDGSIISCKFYKEAEHTFIYGSELGWVEVPNIYYAFYDKDYKVVQGTHDTGVKMSEVEIPENAKYVRLSQSNQILREGTTFMVITEPLTLNTKNDYIPYSIELKAAQYVTKKELEANLTKPVTALTVKSIARIGYDVYNSLTPPEHTIKGYEMAISKGFDEILCDLRSTKDSVPVCLHDATINATARNNDGTQIKEPVNILDLSYRDANVYDYGIRKGEQYKGTKLLKLEEVIKLAKRKGVTVHIETKCLTSATELKMLENAVKIVKKYGMSKHVSWSADSNRIGVLEKIISLDKTARVGTMPMNMTSGRIEELKGLQTGENRVFWFAWDNSELSDEMLNQLIDNNIEMEIGTMNTAESILALMNDNRAYVTGVSSDKLVARLVLK